VPTIPVPALSVGYMPQLDTLRAFAVLFVIASHWLPGNWVVRHLPLGMMGVTLFFVLSGFLITRILLQGRAAASDAGGSRLKVLGHFYVRRTLRIFPAYYLVLLLLWVSGMPDFRPDTAWYGFYAANVLFYNAQAWIGPAPHLWTLSVEEQFYLLWPLTILFVPDRLLGKFIVGTVLLGPMSRGLLFYFSDGTPAAADFLHVLMPTCLDCFGLGALLALGRSRGGFLHGSWMWRGFVTANLASMLWLLDSYSMTAVLLFRLNVSVLALMLVARGSVGFSKAIRPVMENRILVYLGRISYGLYLYHLFVPGMLGWTGLPDRFGYVLTLAMQFALVVLLASASWYGFERPLKLIRPRFASGDRASAMA
jgi:peptidoglycan/LPS O-acetylase OafA/YrhL